MRSSTSTTIDMSIESASSEQLRKDISDGSINRGQLTRSVTHDSGGGSKATLEIIDEAPVFQKPLRIHGAASVKPQKQRGLNSGGGECREG